MVVPKIEFFIPLDWHRLGIVAKMTPTILHLPDEILVKIFEIIGLEDFLRRDDQSDYRHIKNVCTRFQHLYKCVKSWGFTSRDNIHEELEGVTHVKRLKITLDGADAIANIAKKYPELEHLIILSNWWNWTGSVHLTSPLTYKIDDIFAFRKLKALECDGFYYCPHVTNVLHLPKLEYLKVLIYH